MSARRSALYGAGIAAGAVIVAVVVLQTTSGGQTAPTTTRARATTNSLVLIGDDNRMAAAVPLGGVPTRVAYGGGAFWVAVPESGFVARVDAQTHAVRRFRVGEDPYDVAFGGGAVWVPDHDLGRVFHLDPETGSTRATASFGAPAVAAGYGLDAAWAIVVPGDLERIDPRTLVRTHTAADVSYAIEGREPKLLFAGDELFVESPGTSSIARFDRNGKLEETRNVNGLASAAFAGDDLWVGDSASIRRLDGSGTMQAPVGSVADMTASGDSLWVALYGDPVVKRVGTDGKLEATIHLTRTPVALAAGDGTVAIAVTRSSR